MNKNISVELNQDKYAKKFNNVMLKIKIGDYDFSISGNIDVLDKNKYDYSTQKVVSFIKDFEKKVQNLFNKNNIMFLVKENSDMTEGRGVMIFSALFDNINEAENYIDGKTGIMGRHFKREIQYHCSHDGDGYSFVNRHDYRIELVYVNKTKGKNILNIDSSKVSEWLDFIS